MDEADKTEKIAIATLLEILDPKQKPPVSRDKYTQSRWTSIFRTAISS